MGEGRLMTATTDDPTTPRKTPSEAPVIGSTPVEPQTTATPAPRPSAPMIDSALVGAGGDRPAAARKPEGSDAVLRLTEALGPSPIPKTGGAAASGTDKTDAAKADPSRLVSGKPDLAQPGPAKPDLAKPDLAKPATSVPPGGAATSPARPSSSDPSTQVPPVTSRPASPPPAGTPAPEKIVHVRRGGFVPLLLGGAIAAGLGAGAAWYAIPHLPAAWQPVAPPAPAAAFDPAALDARLADLESRSVEAARAAAKDAASAAVKAQAASTAAVAAAPTPEALDAAREAGAEAARKLIAEAPAGPAPDAAVQATLAAQAEQLAALDAAVRQGGTGDLAARVEALAAEVAALESRPTADPAAAEKLAQLVAASDAAQAQLSAVKDEAAKLEDAAAEAARQARANAAAATLSRALDSGVPEGSRAQALADLEQAGVAAPEALQQPAPTLEALQERWDEAARAGLRAALKSDAPKSGNALTNFLRVQTGARSVEPREGTDPDAILSRAGDAVKRGDIPAALAEMTALPEPAKAAMVGWTQDATRWAEARAAVSALGAPAEAAPEAAPAAEAAPTPAAPTPAATN